MINFNFVDRFSTKFSTLTWRQVNVRFLEEFPNILQLMDLVLTLPATNTACERGFSHMKLIKTDRRSTISEEMISDNILIKLQSESIEHFDPMPAIIQWLDLKDRIPVTSGSAERIREQVC